ncbi:hypothetical protein AB4156_35100 [Cupriavidus sp. 2MCAB6]|uniref:hypothetical protein n=1 Tax=Cupriavidus sp. 2MCAB6 TaxID=3232981 RepID=UPI003F936B47
MGNAKREETIHERRPIPYHPGSEYLEHPEAASVALRDARVLVEGDLDFRGTLGVSKETAVGFQAIRLRLELDTDAPVEQV